MHWAKKLSAVVLMLVGGVVFCACAPRSVLEVECSIFHQHQHLSKTIVVPTGDSFAITLCSNPSTGHKWGETLISDGSVLVQEDREYKVARGIGQPAPGSPGEETWTFRSVGPGRATVQLEYGQPWEGGTKSVSTLLLTVDVG